MWEPWNSPDATVRARARGRYITESLARLVRDSDSGAYRLDMREVLAGRASDPVVGTDAGATLRHVWATHIDPYGGWHEDSRHRKGDPA